MRRDACRARSDQSRHRRPRRDRPPGLPGHRRGAAGPRARRRHRPDARARRVVPREPQVAAALSRPRRPRGRLGSGGRGVHAGALARDRPEGARRRPRPRRALLRRAARPRGLDRSRGGEGRANPRAVWRHRRARRREGRGDRPHHLGDDGIAQAPEGARRRAVGRRAEDRSRRPARGDAHLRGTGHRGLPRLPRQRERAGRPLAGRHRAAADADEDLRGARADLQHAPDSRRGRVPLAADPGRERAVREPAHRPALLPLDDRAAARPRGHPAHRHVVPHLRKHIVPTAQREPLALLVAGVVLLVLSGIAPRDRFTWVLEVAPILIGAPILVATRRRFRLSPLLYRLLFVHACVLMVGGHYTYAEVPVGFWLRDALGLARNHYDRLGHFLQGFVPALLAREILLRKTPLRAGGWLFTLVTAVALAISALYEFIEWWTALLTGARGHVGRFVADLGTRPDRAVIGVDFSERSVILARRLNPTLSFVAADVRALPVADGACAGIVAFYSLIYGGDEATAVMLTELRRVLRDGGRLLVAVHGGTGAQRFTDYKGVAIDVELHHRQPVAFAAQVARAGFAVESVEVRPPYAFEHATERLYVAASAA